MNSTDPTKAVTLEELISEGINGELTPDTTYYVNRIDDMIFPTTSVFDSYMDFIYPICVDVELTPDEYYRYKMRPKALSYLLYGTIELWSLLLKLNRVQSSMDFDKKIVKVLDPSKTDILTRIMTYNRERLDKSKERSGLLI